MQKRQGETQSLHRGTVDIILDYSTLQRRRKQFNALIRQVSIDESQLSGYQLIVLSVASQTTM